MYLPNNDEENIILIPVTEENAMDNRVTIIIPCYNEEEALPLYFKAVDPVISSIDDFVFDFILIDDGSKDKTWNIMKGIYETRKDVTIIKETRNYGQQNALFTALLKATGDYVIMMDVDLQDPVELLKDICQKFKEGYDVVNPKRACREKDTFIKRTTAGMFYRFMNFIEGQTVIPENVNNYRGMSRKVVDQINALPEKEKMVFSMTAFVGYKSVEIPFTRQERDAGETKYSIKRLFQVAFTTISCCTSRPLDYPIFFGGVSTCFFSLSSLVLFILYILAACNVMGGYRDISLWMLISFAFLGFSLLMVAIGIIGVYLRNILVNTRNRPMALIEEIHTPKEKKD